MQVSLHLGAKKRDDLASGLAIPDPESLLEWLATDRASVRFREMKDIDANSFAFAHVIRQWSKWV